MKSKLQILMEEIQEAMPALMARVFALRTRSYSGNGFHWSLERRAGKLLAAANDYDEFNEESFLILKMSFRNFLLDIERAEASAHALEVSEKEKKKGMEPMLEEAYLEHLGLLLDRSGDMTIFEMDVQIGFFLTSGAFNYCEARKGGHDAR